MDTIEHIAAALFSLFVYTSDMEQYGVVDDRRSHAEAVRAGQKFKDDCDGFALTAIELLRDDGIPAWIITVSVPKVAGGGAHMIVGLKDTATGTVYVLDNRYPGLRTMRQALGGSLYRISRSSVKD